MAPRSARILTADDQPDILESLRLLLKTEGYEVEAARAPSAVLSAVQARDFDVLLMDLNYARDTTSGNEGLDLLSRIHEIEPMLPIVVMTAWGTIELAVEAMRRGAKDFVQKPWENARLLSIIRTQTELARAVRRARRLEAENLLANRIDRSTFIAESPAMKGVLEVVARVAPSNAPVLITGENGSGKGVLARLLHQLSERASRVMITVNAGGLSEGLFESELFGHVRGAFTDAREDRVGRFEAADGGTLFLDEIANVPERLQPKLLRVVETGEFEPVGSSRTRTVDVRLISATNANLAEMVAQGRFRQDLLFRLNTVEVPLPPLRDRGEDIPLLALKFLEEHAARYRKTIAGFEDAALKALRGYSWPGNVRELHHAVERAVLMAQGEIIASADLGLRAAASTARFDDLGIEDMERLLIQKALARFGGNVSQAAEALGLSRSALYRRLKKHGL
jgi:DNA-binding NtrC family response regulator